jgi:branched-chain amino acid transport system ATP-binding protein
MILDVHDLDVRYGRVHAVKAVSLSLRAGEIVAVLGANGAGKSSLLRTLLGIERAAGGRIEFDGHDVTRWPASRRVMSGMALVPEGRRIVTTLTVHENLLMGGYSRPRGTVLTAEIDEIYARFSNLAARRDGLAAVLSGGEQQMLAIARALLAAPKIMMLDEPSLGLSPRLSEEVFAHIGELARGRNITILLVEQNTQRALDLAHRAYVLELGQVIGEGTPQTLRSDPTLLHAYLGQQRAANSRHSMSVSS